jgi:hypothetical protein
MIDLRDIVFWAIAAALLLASERSSPLEMPPAELWQTVSPILACSTMLPPDCLEPLPGL